LPWTPANAAENVVLHPRRLDQPLRWSKPRMVFVNSMSDLFHEQIPSRFIAQVFAVMAAAHEHAFQVLTKRPERMHDLLASPLFRSLCGKELLKLGQALRLPSYAEWPLPNVWLGVSIENRRYVHRADLLRQTPAAVRFISAEPLLGPLVKDGGDVWQKGVAPSPDATLPGEEWADDYRGPELDLTGIDWLIVGGESGPHHRPIRVEWVRDLRDAAQAEGTAFFFKQWGGRTPKAGGRELDGRTWDEMPETPHAARDEVLR
jgi:protein gp37